MAQVRKTNSRNSLRSEKEGNRSNSNKAGIIRSTPSEKENLILKKQSSSSSLKIFGGDDEVSEDTLWNGSNSDRSLPNSSRSSLGLGSARGRTPTPSKQISLQAVKRIEEKIEPLEKIDWNEIDKPVETNERLPALPLSDLDDDSPRNTPLSPEQQQAVVEERTREMTSALSSCRIDEQEANLSKQLEQIETQREERERKLNLELERQSKNTDGNLTVRDGQFTYRNDHFRDLSNRDKRDTIDSSFILDGMGNSASNVSQKRKGENVIGRHVMDTNPVTAVSAEKDKKQEVNERDESEKKDEAIADTSSDEETDDDDEDGDLIGEKGKAPNNLLMEFLSCMMEEDYENAEKLCKMILIYEPDNEEALNFFPLIQEKIRLEEEDDEDGEDADSSDDSDDEDSDDDDDDDDSDDNDDDDDEEEDSSDGSDSEPVTQEDSDQAYK